MPLLLLLMIWPVIEIILFIKIGGAIGILPTLVLVFGAGAVGVWIVREQGLSAMGDLRRRMATMSDPTEPVAHGMLIGLAGFLFMLPGFLSDIVAMALLVPPVRRWIIRRFALRFGSVSQSAPGHAASDPHRPIVIDAEYYEVDDTSPRFPRRPSGWTED